MKLNGFFDIKKVISKNRNALVFLCIFSLVLITVNYHKYAKLKSDENIIKIGFVTDWEYSENQRTNDRKGGKADKFLKEAVHHFNEKFYPDVVIGGGDYITGSRIDTAVAKQQLQNIVSIFEGVKARTLYIIGSRDVSKITKKGLVSDLEIENAYYFREIKNIRFIVLDTSSGYIDDTQLKWLEETLKINKPVLIFSHKGFVEVPNGDVWKKNVKNDGEIRNLFEKANNVIAAVSGNAGVDFVKKKSNIPYIFVTELINPNKQCSFADIVIDYESDKNIEITFKKYHKGGYLEYLIKRNFADGAVTKIKKIKEINKNDTNGLSWQNIGDENDNGVISDGKGAETNIAVTEHGMLVASFEDKMNNGRIRIRSFNDGNWIDVEDRKNSKGLVSFGKGDTPYIETKKEEIFVSFTEYDRNERPRVIGWDGYIWYNLADANYPEGFLSKYISHEPVISFDKSKTFLYAVFTESSTGVKEESKLKMMKWDGLKWSNAIDDKYIYIKSSYVSEVDIKPSNIDDSMYLTYEDISNDNRIRVAKYRNNQLTVLKDKKYPDGFIGNTPGCSPAIAIGNNDEVYLIFSTDKPGKTFVYKWDGIEWNVLGDGMVTSKDTIESTIVLDKDSDNIFVSYSEYKEGVVRKRVYDNGNEEMRKRGTWRVKVKKWKNGDWYDVENSNNGYISSGNGKGDPSMVIYDNMLYVIFTDEESGNRARVRAYSFENSK